MVCNGLDGSIMVQIFLNSHHLLYVKFTLFDHCTIPIPRGSDAFNLFDSVLHFYCILEVGIIFSILCGLTIVFLLVSRLKKRIMEMFTVLTGIHWMKTLS